MRERRVPTVPDCRRQGDIVAHACSPAPRNPSFRAASAVSELKPVRPWNREPLVTKWGAVPQPLTETDPGAQKLGRSHRNRRRCRDIPQRP